MSLPTAIEINPIPECLDGKCAVEHFEGKSLDQAEKLFAENGLYYSGDLLWMGPIGFTFYFKASLAYLKSEASQDDSDFLNSMISTLESRILDKYNDYADIRAGLEDYSEFCSYALDHYDKYDLEESIYGDLRSQLKILLNKIEASQSNETQ